MKTIKDIKFISNASDLYSLKSKESFMFKCENCGNFYINNQFKKNKRYDVDGKLLCGKCRFKLNYNFEEAKNKRDHTKLEKYGDQNYTNREKAKETVKTLYGVYNVFELKDVQEKSKETKKEKYGDENYRNRDKAKKTMLSRYGVEYSGQSDELLQKTKDTKLERYGDQNYSNKEKAIETKYNLYGDPNYNNRDKARETCIEIYGTETPFAFGSEEFNNNLERKYGEFYKTVILESVIKTNREKYGCDFPLESENIRKKSREKMLKKYGVVYSVQSEEIRKKMKKKYEYSDGYRFDSGWELCLWIYAKDHNEEIEREPAVFEYEFNGELHKYSPDFKYNGKLVEIKGPQYFLNHDPKQRMIFPYTRLHSDSELLTEEEKKYMDDLYEAKHQCGLSNGVEFWSKEECLPYVEYVENIYGKDYISKFKLQ